MGEREKILQKINDLIQQLTSPASDLGDWKIIQYIEYTTAGLEPPFDMKEMHTKRQQIRDEIDDLRKQL